MEEARWGAVCPDTFTAVLMIEGKSRSHGRAITATYKVVKGYTPADLQALLGHEMQETSFI